MTSREAFEAWLNPGKHAGNVSAWIEPGRYEKATDQMAWLGWKYAIEWASKQAHDAIEEIDDGEAPEYRACQEVIREALK